MCKFLSAIGNWATKIESWLALGAMAMSAGVFAWLGQQWELLAAQGWAAVTMFALLSGAIAMIGVSLSYLALSRRLAPTVVAPDVGSPTAVLPAPNPATEPNDEEQEADSEPQEIEGPPFRSDGLYVGKMQVSLGMLDTRQVEVSMTCFNGTGHSILVRKVSGSITMIETKDRKPVDEYELPTALVSERVDLTREISSYAEFHVSLEQPVTKHIGDVLSEVDGNHSASFYLENLNVMVSPVEFPENLFRLPLWDGVSVRRDGKSPHWGRIHLLKASL